MSQDSSILKVREEGSQQYRRTFLGSQILDWLVKRGEVRCRSGGEEVCKTMLQYGLIRHVTGRYHFSDSDLLFQFAINFRRKRNLTEVLDDSSSLTGAQQESPDSPFCLRKLSDDLPQGSFVCVLKKPVTVEELLAPGAPYIRKTLHITSDDVGWGFVARGNGPCHIQAMDPGGPAALAGMKLRQFIVSVNGINCLSMPYLTIYKYVVAGPRTVIMEVLEPTE